MLYQLGNNIWHTWQTGPRTDKKLIDILNDQHLTAMIRKTPTQNNNTSETYNVLHYIDIELKLWHRLGKISMYNDENDDQIEQTLSEINIYLGTPQKHHRSCKCDVVILKNHAMTSIEKKQHSNKNHW